MREKLILWLQAAGFEVYQSGVFSTSFRRFLPNSNYMIAATLHSADRAQDIWERVAEHGWRARGLTKNEKLDILKISQQLKKLYDAAPF